MKELNEMTFEEFFNTYIDKKLSKEDIAKIQAGTGYGERAIKDFGKLYKQTKSVWRHYQKLRRKNR